MTIDSTIEFEKRRNVPVRYDRELLQTTLKAMKRVGEIKKRREHAFWKSRMAASRERKLAHRRKTLGVSKAPVKLIEPISVDPQTEKIRQKIKVPTKARSALIPGDGRSMDMDVD